MQSGAQGGDCRVECVGGDLSLTATRDTVFETYDALFPAATHVLRAASAWVLISSTNSEGLTPQAWPLTDHQ